jgi:hypothetical protein
MNDPDPQLQRIDLHIILVVLLICLTIAFTVARITSCAVQTSNKVPEVKMQLPAFYPVAPFTPPPPIPDADGR